MRDPSINVDVYDEKISKLINEESGNRSARIGQAVSVFLILMLATAGCGRYLDEHLCGAGGCTWSDQEWARASALAGLPATPPEDRSNKFVGDPAAEALGHKWFFEARFSGAATLLDQLRRPVPYARAPKGQPSGTSCATCHDLANGSIDDTSVPGNVSVGTGWFDVNAQPTLNAAFYTLSFWNGRADSLWAQALAAAEGGVSMNGNRLHIAWVIADLYRKDYQAAFPEAPLPMSGPL